MQTHTQFKLASLGLHFYVWVKKLKKIDATCVVCLTIAMMVMVSILCQTAIALSTENPPSYVLPLIASMTLMAMEAINKLFSHVALCNLYIHIHLLSSSLDLSMIVF
jgi:hypothetical protein